MQTKPLGKTDLELSRLGFGTYALGGDNWAYAWGKQDDAESLAAMHRGFDLGINWIDVAPAYGFGHAEEVVGQALRARQERIYVATKCGIVWETGSQDIIFQLGRDSIRREVEASLKRLGVEVIDLYQIHWPNPDADVEEAWGTVAELVQEGLIRYGGVSNFSLSQLERAQGIHPIASLQPPYSMLSRGIEGGILEYCAAHDIGVVAYSPMESGLLTGKFSRERVAALPDNDWRKTEGALFREPQLSAALDLVERLRPVAEGSGYSVAELAIAWVLQRPEVTAAIVGARRPAQIEGTTRAADWTFSAEASAAIRAALASHENALRDAVPS